MDKLGLAGEFERAEEVRNKILRDHPADLPLKLDAIRDSMRKGDFKRARELCGQCLIVERRRERGGGTGMLWDRTCGTGKFELVKWQIDRLEEYSESRVSDATEEHVIIACIARIRSASRDFGWSVKNRYDFENVMSSVAEEEMHLLVEKGDACIPYLYMVMIAEVQGDILMPMILGRIGSEAAIRALVDGLLSNDDIVRSGCSYHLAGTGDAALRVLREYLFGDAGPENPELSSQLKKLIVSRIAEMIHPGDTREGPIPLMSEIVSKSDESEIIALAGMELAEPNDESALSAAFEALKRTDDLELEQKLMHFRLKSTLSNPAGNPHMADAQKDEWKQGLCSVCGVEVDMPSMGEHVMSFHCGKPGSQQFPEEYQSLLDVLLPYPNPFSPDADKRHLQFHELLYLICCQGIISERKGPVKVSKGRYAE